MIKIPSGTKFVGISSTVPTPENRSAQNNSTTEIYTIDDVVETVEAGLPASPTTCIVTIPSAADGEITYSDGRPNATGGILGMGSSPIELLPAPGVGKYYEVDKITFEYNHNTTGYTIANRLYVYGGDMYVIIKNSLIADGYNYVGSVVPSPSFVDTVPVFQLENITNSSLTFGVEGGVNPTDGNGTLLAIITYTLRTFGA